MKITEIITETTDSVIKQTVDTIRQNIKSFGSAKIDGQSSVLNVSGKQVSKTLGINLDALAAHETNSAWVHKNGRDNYSMGYKI